MDASRDFFNFNFNFSPNEQRAGGGGCAARLFLFLFFPCSADHERDWPPCKVVFFGLATSALNVRNNNNNNNSAICYDNISSTDISYLNILYIVVGVGKIYGCRCGHREQSRE